MNLLEPFQYEFFRSAFAIAIVAGAICGLIGTFVVLRSMSYIGHGLSHAIFGWAVISFVVGINFYVGAALGGFASALAVNGVARRRTIGADAAIGVVTTTVFAVGVALMSGSSRGFTRNFESVLFGNILGSAVSDLVIVSAVGLAVLIVILVNYRGLLFSTFDPEVAAVSGARVSRLDALLALTLAGTIVVTMQVLGVLLVAAGLVMAPVTARLLTDSFGRMLWISALIGAASGAIGLELSYFRNIATGPSIVLVSAALFIVAFIVSGRKRALAPLPH